MEFNSLEELKKRLIPALKIKASEFQKSGIEHVDENDIWDYLKDNKWTTSINLSLSDMVDDILKLDIRNICR